MSNETKENPFEGRTVKYEAIIALREYEGMPGVIDMDLKSKPTAAELKSVFESEVLDSKEIPVSILLALAAIDHVRTLMKDRVGEEVPLEFMPKLN